MQVTNYTINAIGLKEIHAFLAANHKMGGEHFDQNMINAWASDAEDSLNNGNLPIIEIKSFDSVTGYPATYQITDAGIDSEVVGI